MKKSLKFFQIYQIKQEFCLMLLNLSFSSESAKKRVVNKVEVTDVRLRTVNSESRMKAISSITLDDEFVIHDIRVIDGNNGLFVAMPSRRTPDGEFRDIAHPINSNMRAKIQSAVLAKYEQTRKDAEKYEEAGVS